MKRGHEKVQTDLNWVHLYLKNGNYPPGLTAIEKRIVRKRAEQFCFMNDELYFLGTLKSKEIGQVPRKVLLTYEERWDVINKAHVAQDGTHLGLERTLEPVTDKYYWVGISRTARDYIRQCLVCLERNPRLGHGSISGAASVTDGSYDDGSSITGEDTLSLSGTEVVSTSGDADPFYEQYSVFTRETAKTFWEMVDLRLYGPFKASQKNTYILMALDGYSLWPEAFILETVSPASIAQSILKLICRYGQMGKLVMSQEDEVLETAILKALDILKHQGSINISLAKTIIENIGEQYDELDYLLEQFIATHPKTWADCMEYCLLPLRTSCLQGADYTPSFLAHSREIQLPQILTQYASAESRQTEGTIMREPSMTEAQKRQILDMMMQLNETVTNESCAAMVVQEMFRPPQAGKSLEKEATPQATSTPRAIVTRARSGTEKPKQFDDSYITPAKRKATVPVQTASEAKKVKVEIVTSGTGETYHIVENTGKMDEVAGQVNEEECKELPSDSETDLSAVTKSGTKLTVDLDHFYKCISQYLTSQTYMPNSSFKFKTLIREAAKQYKLVDNDLYFKADTGKDLKVITTKEERLHLLEWAHIGLDKSHQSQERMLEDLLDGQVHWKGKSLDCESFALACPDCENCNKDIKLALKNMQEEKKLIGFDTYAVYDEIRMFLRPNIFPNAGKSLDGIKKYLNSFKIEGDQLTYVTDMKKKRVVISAAERVKLIAEAHLDSAKHQDVRYTLSKVFGNNFWFGMKIDIKVFVTYCCNVKDGKCLNDRYFMFRSYFMKKGSGEQIGKVVRVRDVEDVQTDSGTEDHEHTETVSVDIAGNVPDVTQDIDNIEDVGAEKPTGIFVSTSETGLSPVTRSKSNVRVSVMAVESNRVSEKGDATSEAEDNHASVSGEPQTVHVVSSDSQHTYVVKLREPDRQTETEKQNVVVEMNEGGDHAINIKLQKVLTTAKQHGDVSVKDSDPITMAAVKSILPDGASDVANVINEIEVGGEESSPVKIGEASVEMRDRSVDTSVDLVVNESDIMDEETDEDEEDDDDEDDTIDVSTSQIHSELLSRLTETLTPSGASQSSAEKKTVTPRQHFKCSICNRVFYGPNKFKTHIYRHTGQKPFACSMCNKKYTNNKSLVIHERTHTGELPFLCNTCGKRMPSKVSLKSHLKVHDGKGGGMPCKCDICGRDFTRRHLMERHRNFKHINLQTEFKCSECPKVFGHQRSLKRHFMSHHMGVKNHICDLCGKAFYRKEYLTSHQAQHAGLTIEMAKRKRQELRAANKPSMHYVKEDEEEVQQESRDGEEVRRIVLHQDEDGTLRVVDLETEHQVRKILASQLGQPSHDGETMVVQIQESASPTEQHVLQIEEQGSEIKQQVIEIQREESQLEQRVVQVDHTGTPVKQAVVEVENNGHTEEVVEVPVEGESYVEYQPMEESSDTYITVGAQTNLPTSYPYSYSSSQADISGQANQELIYGQPAVQYEVECVGDVGDEEALSAINLLAQASAAQYENVVVSQI